MGTAAARALSARGRAVVLLERFTIGHEKGSTAGTTRNFRLTYHDPLYVRMARRSLEGWRELEDEAGVELLRVVGGLDMGAATDASARALQHAGERFERPSDAEVAERWPMLRFPPHSSFVYQPDGAVLRSREGVRAIARLATAHGADLREETAAESIMAGADGVDVVTAASTLRAPSAIVAAGAWTGSLLERTRIRLTLRPTLEQSTYFDADATELPTVIDWDESPDQPPYIVPDPFEPGTIKAGAHLSGPVVDPDTRSFDADGAREQRVADWVGRRLVSTARSLRTETCLYTRTQDEDFVLDRVGPIVIASPCSGHGFKFTPLIGEVLADLVTGEAAEIPLQRFRADRAAVRG
jgi:sarcosine oxidase